MLKYQHYDSGDDNDRDGWGVNWMAQTFTTQTIHLIAKVKLKLFRVGDPGTVIVSIKATTDDEPSGADLCSGEIEGNVITEDGGGDWYEISLGDGFTFNKETKYAIVVKAPDGDTNNKISWRADITDPTYARGYYCVSSNSGESWDKFETIDCMFEEWGVGEPAPTTVTWGQLSKSQISAEKIEAAISRLIAAHNDDSDAHIGEGRSLNSHKTQEILDHLVNSIVEDKLSDQCVANEKFKFNQFKLESYFESIDGWTTAKLDSGSVTLALASVLLATGATSLSWARLSGEAFEEGNAADYLKNPRFIVIAKALANTSQEIFLNCGSWDLDGFGFKIVNGTLYALHLKDTDEYTTDISVGVNILEWHRYKAIYTSGEKIEFYVDDILRATHDSNLPEDGADAADEINYFSYRIKNTAAANKRLVIKYCVLQQDT